MASLGDSFAVAARSRPWGKEVIYGVNGKTGSFKSWKHLIFSSSLCSSTIIMPLLQMGKLRQRKSKYIAIKVAELDLNVGSLT